MEQKEEEPVNPRVQIELERLNASSEDINKLENKLEEANALFRRTLRDSTASLKLLSRRVGSAVEKARPYYEAREKARRTQLDCHKAAVQFQRASVLHQNARETIQLAEQRFLPRHSGSNSRPRPQQFEFDSAWQEMLNHATMKLLEAEHLKHSSETEHLRRAITFSEAQRKLKQLERSLERHVGRARPYFDQREVVQQELVRQKAVIQQLQRAVSSAKARYSSSLRELENISEQIHQQRRLRELEPDLIPIDLDTRDLDSVSAATESATSDYEEDFRLSQEQQYWTEMREQIEAMSANLPGGTEPAPPTSPQLEVPAPAFPAGQPQQPEPEPQPQQQPEPPLAEELNAERLIARRRRTVSEAAGGGGGGRQRRLSLAAGWPRGPGAADVQPAPAAAAGHRQQFEEVQLEDEEREQETGAAAAGLQQQLEQVQLGDEEREQKTGAAAAGHQQQLEEVQLGDEEREQKTGAAAAGHQQQLEEVQLGDEEREQKTGAAATGHQQQLEEETGAAAAGLQQQFEEVQLGDEEREQETGAAAAGLQQQFEEVQLGDEEREQETGAAAADGAAVQGGL